MSWYLTAKAGDKVVCIDGEPKGAAWPVCEAAGCRFPTKGKIYTIRQIAYSDFKRSWVLRLVEIVNPPVVFPPWRPGELTFGARRFRPLVSRPTDISEFTKLLKRADQRQPEAA